MSEWRTAGRRVLGLADRSTSRTMGTFLRGMRRGETAGSRPRIRRRRWDSLSSSAAAALSDLSSSRVAGFQRPSNESDTNCRRVGVDGVDDDEAVCMLSPARLPSESELDRDDGSLVRSGRSIWDSESYSARPTMPRPLHFDS